MIKYYFLRAECSICGSKAYYIYYTKPTEPDFATSVFSYKNEKVLTSEEADEIIKNSPFAWERIEGKIKIITYKKFI